MATLAHLERQLAGSKDLNLVAPLKAAYDQALSVNKAQIARILDRNKKNLPVYDPQDPNSAESLEAARYQALLEEGGRLRAKSTMLGELMSRLKTRNVPTQQGATTPVNPLAGSIGARGSKLQVRAIPKRPSPQAALDRQQGLELIKQHPDKAAAIRARFKRTHGVNIGG
ncbi:hypothetical protein OP10G_3627 [Fimbriimonas ginsengisoli Gsoil 348]|uniref:Uncharacterized protein n=2 Tax=Fimbriimonas ginsengisoli TaxID=1005039 RepID=A0A068NW43_FIMGI|nr:hypothetical protein OP10G_3627 [Fimbriimonas ginsengisoli Gsoil 348]